MQHEGRARGQMREEAPAAALSSGLWGAAAWAGEGRCEALLAAGSPAPATGEGGGGQIPGGRKGGRKARNSRRTPSSCWSPVGPAASCPVHHFDTRCQILSVRAGTPLPAHTVGTLEPGARPHLLCSQQRGQGGWGGGRQTPDRAGLEPTLTQISANLPKSRLP